MVPPMRCPTARRTDVVPVLTGSRWKVRRQRNSSSSSGVPAQAVAWDPTSSFMRLNVQVPAGCRRTRTLPVSPASSVTLAERRPEPAGIVAAFVPMRTGSGAGQILHRQGQRGAREVRYSDLRQGLGDIDDLLDGSGQGDRAIGRAAERAARRPCPPAVEAVAARRERPACEPALVHEKSGIDEKVRPRHVGNAAGKRCDAARALDQERVAPFAPSGETRMRKSSLPIKPGFRTAAEGALVELREHVRLGALVEHEAQIAGSALRLRQSREQSRIEFRGKTVQAVGNRAEAEPLRDCGSPPGWRPTAFQSAPSKRTSRSSAST